MDFAAADAINSAIRSLAIDHRALAAHHLSPLGLHPGQESVLLALDASGPMTQVQLAAAAGCEPPSITGMVRKLELAGLVRRQAAASDGRAISVALTAKGSDLIPELKQVWRALADATVAELIPGSEQVVTAALADAARSVGNARLRHREARPG